MTETQELAAAHAMTKYGGSFAASVGFSYFVADQGNRERLVAAFPELFEKHLRLQDTQENPMSYKPQVTTGTDPKFYGNALAFATFDEAYYNARDLSYRWMLVTDYRAIESDDPVTHTYVDGVLGYAVKEEEKL